MSLLGNSSNTSHTCAQRIKFITLGEYGVGKSTLMKAFVGMVRKSPDPHYVPTVGVDFLTTSVRHELTESIVKGIIWDTAGQERFNSLISSYVIGVSGVIYVFDITNRKSFTSIKDKWCEFVMRNQSGGVQVAILIGNKVDLESSRTVSSEEARKFAGEYGMVYYETHAKNPYNVGLFKEIVNKIRIEPPVVLEQDTERIGCIPKCKLL